jgi:exonuclease SbcD
MRVTVRGIVRKTPEGEIDYDRLIIPLMKGTEVAAWCLAVPYLRQGDYPVAASYVDGVGKMYKNLYERVSAQSLPVIAMGHLQATGSECSDGDPSERTLIGGLEAVSPDSFANGIAYIALGHLHRAQRVSGRDNLRYAGAPLPMSFAEKNNKQSVMLVDITGGQTRMEAIAFVPPVSLLSIPREALPLKDVLEEIARLDEGEITARSPYVEIKVLITGPEPSLRHHIEEALKNKSIRLARIAAVSSQKEDGTNAISYEDLQTIHPMDIALDLFRRKYQNEMPGSMQTLLQSVIQEVER